jgi:hypothetical protein
VRDGSGGVGLGGIQLQVQDTGTAFAVREPDAFVSIKRNEGLSVIWDVANTDSSPISCSRVNIELSTDGGQRFTTILEKTRNDGSEIVTIPSNTPENTTARLKISCSDNIFFALSPANFTIKGTGDKQIPVERSGGLILWQFLLLFVIVAIRRLYIVTCSKSSQI